LVAQKIQSFKSIMLGLHNSFVNGQAAIHFNAIKKQDTELAALVETLLAKP
jgi:hypothetical protein